MRLLVVSEGKNELHPDRADGALTNLVRRILGLTPEFDRRDVRDLGARVHLRKGIGDGMLKKAQSWLRFAEEEEFDGLVFLIDRDDDPKRQAQLDAAQGDLQFQIPRAIGLAIRSFDAWMLADEVALTKALGFVVNRQRAPESLEDPKAVCQELCANQMSLSDLYSNVSEHIRLDELEKRCVKGFAPFATRVRQLQR